MTNQNTAVSTAAESVIEDTGKGSSLISRNVSIDGHRTSIRLEPEMWQALKDISRREGVNSHAVCSLVARRKRPLSSLTAAIRVFVMLYYRAAATDEGHKRAGHGNMSQMIARAGIADTVRYAAANASVGGLSAPHLAAPIEE